MVLGHAAVVSMPFHRLITKFHTSRDYLNKIYFLYESSRLLRFIVSNAVNLPMKSAMPQFQPRSDISRLDKVV